MIRKQKSEFFSRNISIRAHGSCLVLQLTPIQINRAELQYQILPMDKSGAVAGPLFSNPGHPLSAQQTVQCL